MARMGRITTHSSRLPPQVLLRSRSPPILPFSSPSPCSIFIHCPHRVPFTDLTFITHTYHSSPIAYALLLICFHYDPVLCYIFSNHTLSRISAGSSIRWNPPCVHDLAPAMPTRAIFFGNRSSRLNFKLLLLSCRGFVIHPDQPVHYQQNEMPPDPSRCPYVTHRSTSTIGLDSCGFRTAGGL